MGAPNGRGQACQAGYELQASFVAALQSCSNLWSHAHCSHALLESGAVNHSFFLTLASLDFNVLNDDLAINIVCRFSSLLVLFFFI